MNTKTLLFIVLIFSMTGCGTFNSVVREDAVVLDQLRKRATRCSWMPRMYGGVAYDFCNLHSEPRPGAEPPPVLEGTRTSRSAPLFIWDMPLSFIFDTVLLPYTVYEQKTKGSLLIPLKK